MASGKTKSGVARQVLATLGLFAAGFFAANYLKTPRRHVSSFIDKTLRRLIFQLKRESAATRERSAISIIREVAVSFSTRFMNHNIISVAAGAAFFLVLAVFPGLAALVSLYGLIGNPADIQSFLDQLPNVIPDTIIQLFRDFLNQLMLRPETNLSAFILGLLIAFWSASSGMKALIEALNVVYNRSETRSLVHFNILALVMTLAFMIFMVAAINIMILPVSDWVRDTLGDAILNLRWLVLLFAMLMLISAIYYFAPAGRQTHWYLLTAGATSAAFMWIFISMLFSYYLTNFANYSVTYGSLGAAAIFMTWLWLTVTALLAGAELDAAIENLGHDQALAEG